MQLVRYDPQADLTNQFTMTYGPKGSGKSTFGLSMGTMRAPGSDLLVLDLDRRSFSARRTAREKWDVNIVEIPGLESDPDDKRTLLEVLDKKQIQVKKKSGGTYPVWALNKKDAEKVKALIEEGLELAVSSPNISGIFIDDAKVLGSIWAAAYSPDGRISSINQMEWGEVYGPLANTLSKLTRTAGCTKDVLLSHHMKDERKKNVLTGEDERTGNKIPNWVDRIVQLSDNVIEHYVNGETFQLGLRFVAKVPADRAELMGRSIEGLDNMHYDFIKSVILGEMEVPEAI